MIAHNPLHGSGRAGFPHPALALGNDAHAGILQIDDVAGAVDEVVLVSIITTNGMGPIRMTSALVDHLKKQDAATVINVSSGLGFVPLAVTAVYSATKAAMHSYSMSLRYKLKKTSVKVVELAPPWVQTDLLDGKENPNAMPLAQFIDETMKILETDTEEVVVEQAKRFRNNPGPGEAALVTQFNGMMAQAQ
jgi:uncharacterized oxidoreductase